MTQPVEGTTYNSFLTDDQLCRVLACQQLNLDLALALGWTEHKPGVWLTPSGRGFGCSYPRYTDNSWDCFDLMIAYKVHVREVGDCITAYLPDGTGCQQLVSHWPNAQHCARVAVAQACLMLVWEQLRNRESGRPC